MADYINVDEAIIDFGFEWDDIAPTREEFINFLKSRKRANAKEVVYAHWIKDEFFSDDVNNAEKCSQCGELIGWFGKLPNYCPECGAEMSEKT